jgi:3-deoxy-D-manno-octulosonic-acid transferase/heptosyltransferase-1
MDILIVKMSALGDVVHTLPALTTLRRHEPRAHITWLIEPAAEPLIRGHSAIDNVLVWNRQKWQALTRGLQWTALSREFIGHVRQLRSRTFDLIIDFQGLAKSALWVSLARGVRKAGFDRGLPRNEAGWIVLNERIPPVSPDIHAIDRGLMLLEALGFPRLPVTYDLPIDPAAEARAESLLRAAGLDPGRPFVAINPMTRWPTKNWEPSRFAAVIDGLSAQRLPVVITGGADDQAAIDEIVGRSRAKAPRLDGQTSLKSLAAVYRRSRVVLSTDTGPMHLAAAVGTRVVALFGPTAPWRTGPYGPEHVVIRCGIECSPCFERVCRTTLFEKHACMLRLEPAQVLAVVSRQWESAG